jgi:hypothetical protein
MVEIQLRICADHFAVTFHATARAKDRSKDAAAPFVVIVVTGSSCKKAWLESTDDARSVKMIPSLAGCGKIVLKERFLPSLHR